ncbi:hypothetical protein Tco_1120855 [Tanacetum coccineum]|uniref:Integrase, catalytic region, zinc finger, CCHC-type, peptidase aspartic, catalytic n=1 Tax=Tanacetum coccineum TaxID=301880 RepID=A0ABQ5IW19_9ASTR
MNQVQFIAVSLVQNVQGRQNRGQGNNAQGGGAAGYGGAQNRVGNANPGQARQIKCFVNCNMVNSRQTSQPRNCTHPSIPTDVILQDKMLLRCQSSGEWGLIGLAHCMRCSYCLLTSGQDNYIDEYIDENLAPMATAGPMFLDKMLPPPGLSKENYLATFTPHKQLTPEQIFWSQYLFKMKAEALKKQTTASRPIKALMVYPPNTPTTLVPRVLPTKSQVKINIFTLIQLFSEFEKTCKKRITPTGLTEGERGFEQTKECYLKEAIPFFKTLKEHLEGIQKALTKEIKEMKDVFEELEVEVDQHVVDKKHDKIEWKNLLITHDNLITDCLSKEVFYVATNYELKVSRFTKMHDAHTIVEARRTDSPLVFGLRLFKTLTRDRSRLRNFMKMFIGTVRFGNDHFGAIMGYGDYVIGNNVISRVYYVEGLGHNLFSVRQFFDSDLEVAFMKHSCYVRDTDGVELIKEAVATTCYTQNRSLIHTRHDKTPYELVHDKKPDLTLFRVFGALCYPTNDSEDLSKLQPTANIGIFLTEQMATVQLSIGHVLLSDAPGQIVQWLCTNILVPADLMYPHTIRTGDPIPTNVR